VNCTHACRDGNWGWHVPCPCLGLPASATLLSHTRPIQFYLYGTPYKAGLLRLLCYSLSATHHPEYLEKLQNTKIPKYQSHLYTSIIPLTHSLTFTHHIFLPRAHGLDPTIPRPFGKRCLYMCREWCIYTQRVAALVMAIKTPYSPLHQPRCSGKGEMARCHAKRQGTLEGVAESEG
jgi:hypothetical protein